MDECRRCGRLVGFGTIAILSGCIAFGQMGGVPGNGQQPPGVNPNLPNNPSVSGIPEDRMNPDNDKFFVRHAMEGNTAEIDLGQLALKKSTSPEVKQFAQRMIDDHQQMNEQLVPIAQQLGVSAPAQPSKKDRSNEAKLQALSGSDFDQAYVRDMVKDHRKDLQEFKQAATSAQDSSVRDAASEGSRVISQHLQLAEQLAKDQNITVSKL